MLNVDLQSLNKVTTSIRSKLNSVVIATKNLKLQKVSKNSEHRKLVISTNFLDLINLPEGTAVTECVLDNNQGIEVVKADIGGANTKKIYGRNYKNRSNTRESQIDMRSQKKINQAFGSANEVRVIFTHEKVTIKPIFAPTDKVLDQNLEINIHNEDGVYVGILAAIRVIKENMFTKVTSVLESTFIESQEFVLFSMQLRRLGYALNLEGDQLIATHPKNITTHKTRFINTANYTDTNTPQPLKFNKDNPLSSFVMCTAGVDIKGMEMESFDVASILSYRPPEARDYKKSTCKKTNKTITTFNDKTESNIMVAAINTKQPKHLFNEDIFKFDANNHKKELEAHNFIHISLECSDFSPLKTIKERMRFIDSLESTRDMFFYPLEVISTLRIPTILVENVKSYTNSVESKLFNYRLKELGYSVATQTLNAREHNGMSNRERSFTFASILPVSFSFPKNTPSTNNVWKDIIEPSFNELRDVTHTNSVQKAITTKRLRPLQEGAKFSPCLTKSQQKQTKDSVYIFKDGKYYMPSINIMKGIMGVPKSFDLSFVPKDLASEIIGQSVCLSMHKAILNKIKSHINKYKESTTNSTSKKYFYELLFA